MKWQYFFNHSISISEKANRVCIFFVPQLIFLLILLYKDLLHYATNDDTTMVALAAGAYGSPSEFLINSHIFIGFLTKFLFSNFPVINWLSVIYLTIELMSFIAINVVFLKKNSSALKCAFDSAIIFCCFVIFITYFTFTTVAYISGIAGCIWCIHNYEHSKRLFSTSNIYGLVLIVCSVMVRKDCAVAIILILIPFLIFEYTKFKDKKILLLPLFVLIIMLLFSYLDQSISSHSQIQKSFLEWGKARSKALDSTPVDYEMHKSQFDSIGFSRASYQAAYNAFYYNKMTFSTEAFDRLSKFNSIHEKFNFDLIEALKQIRSQLTNFSYNNFYTILTFILFLSMVYVDKRNYCKYIIFLLSPIMLSLLFFILNRSPYRVVMPNYIFSILLILFYSPAIVTSSLTLSFKDRYHFRCPDSMILLCISFVSALLLVVSYFKQPVNPLYDKSISKVISYLENHNDELFLAGEPSVFSLDVNRSFFDFAGRNARWNLVGNWETYSKPYYELIRNYPVSDPDNIVNDLPDSKKIKLLTAQSFDLPDYVLDFISEKTGKKIDKVLVESVSDTAFGDWHVYSIVTVNK